MRGPTRTGAALGAVAAVLMSVLALAPTAHAATGLHVSNGRLVEGNGSDFVMRGVNHAHTWYASRTAKALSDIKALKANTVRVVLSTGDRWTKNDTADVANVVAQCKQNRPTATRTRTRSWRPRSRSGSAIWAGPGAATAVGSNTST
ncbi:hypothetical protein [Streptomyces sp. NPDC007917]|uniref:hypothetical protein n=1 Tax=Streptomyces sp. NPDC007917 TaxID=3364793 RepID=UPI0036EF12F9